MVAAANRTRSGRLRLAAVGLALLAAAGCGAPAAGAPDLPVPTAAPATTTTAAPLTTPPTTTPRTTTPPTTAPPTTTAPTTAPPTTAEAAPTTGAEQGPVPLRRGASGPEVLAVQERLGELGYWLGTPDSTYGSLTEQAVLALQGAAGLRRDGVLGPDTRTALDTGVRPTPRSSQGAVTEIDRDAGLVVFVRDGRVEVALHTSTGTFERYTHEGRRLLADTPEGDFAVTWSHDGWREGDLGRLYRPRYFHPDGIAVHGYTSVPAYPASHGCARVSTAAMDMVWERDLMPLDSAVQVY